MDTRKYDLQILYDGLKSAKYQHDRWEIEQTIDKISREGGYIRSEREDLVKAFRVGDKRAIRRAQENINRYMQNKTYGRQIS